MSNPIAPQILTTGRKRVVSACTACYLRKQKRDIVFKTSASRRTIRDILHQEHRRRGRKGKVYKPHLMSIREIRRCIRHIAKDWSTRRLTFDQCNRQFPYNYYNRRQLMEQYTYSSGPLSQSQSRPQGPQTGDGTQADTAVPSSRQVDTDQISEREMPWIGLNGVSIEPKDQSRHAASLWEDFRYFEYSDSNTLSLLRKNKRPVLTLDDVEFAVLTLRVCLFASQFLPSPSYTIDTIRDVPLTHIRDTCCDIADKLATISASVHLTGPMIRLVLGIINTPQMFTSLRFIKCGPKEKFIKRYIYDKGRSRCFHRPMTGWTRQGSRYSIGEWVSVAQHRIKDSHAARWSAKCVLGSILAFKNKSYPNLASTRESNAKALRCIRASLETNSSGPFKSDAMLAIKLLFVAECMTSLRSGRDSGFYGSAWFNMPPPKTVIPGCPRFEFAMKRVMQHQIETTHFIKLVRAVGVQPENETLRDEAIGLGSRLYREDLESWIKQLLSTSALKLIPSSMLEVALFFRNSYKFSSTRLFNLIMNYWGSRILICRGIQTLYSFLNLGSQSLNLSTVQEHYIQAADNIAMSFEYAWNYDTCFPIVALRALTPLQMAFNAWHRLDKRQRESGGTGYANGRGEKGAMEMKEWCVRMGNKTAALLGEGRATCEYMELKSDSNAGGPLFAAR
ncbi:hypothetical protein G7Y89_g6643 [Cudoniella acicularis]|uniref:Uncharacterized protein n=1 Tax=Cudoniella acicularis TaxID=354080 RepID=A0A8H4RLV6_9HELO|nr:hypothetical protein G7Y89_g6643 [Cudoniella acicularis]